MKATIRIAVILLLLFQVNLMSSQVDCTAPNSTFELKGLCNELDDLTDEEILAMPTLNTNVVFHLESAPSGKEWLFGNYNDLPQENRKQHAPRFCNDLMDEMNRSSSEAIDWSDGLKMDTRMRFNLLTNEGNNGIFIYPYNSSNFDSQFSPNFVDDAVNVIIWHYEIGIDVNPNGFTGQSGFVHDFFENHLHINMNIDELYQEEHTLESFSRELLGRNVVHENAHLMGLDHVHNCNNACNGIAFDVDEMCCTSSCVGGNGPAMDCFGGCNQYIMGFNGGQTDFSYCEHKIMWTNAFRNSLPQYSFCNSESEIDELVYDNNQVNIWSGTRLINADVIIKSGTTIEVQCDVLMGANKKILVERGGKLIINGGRITNLCNDKWRGIVVEGDASSGTQLNAGVVELYTDSDGDRPTIEEAIDGISTYTTHITWPQTPEYFGGKIVAHDAIFRNCNRAVAFMKYATGIVDDESEFVNCDFENIQNSAVTIWSSNGITFDGCTFDGVGVEGVLAYDAATDIFNDSNFNDMPTGVTLLGTVPLPESSQIGNLNYLPNNFICDDYGVNINSSGNNRPITVENCNFLGGLKGVEVDGDNHFLIENCDFISQDESTSFISTGNHDNFIRFNNIGSATIGSNVENNNEGVEYLGNCFEFNQQADIEVGNASIFTFQGNLVLAAGNCFSSSSIPEINIAQNNEVLYFIKNDVVSSDCEYPIDSPNLEINDDPNDEYVGVCGATQSPGITNFTSFCDVILTTIEDHLERIDELEEIITRLESDTELTPWYRRYLLAQYRRCLDKLTLQTVTTILETSSNPTRTDSAIQFLKSRTEYKYHILAYGMMVNINQLNQARAYLLTLDTSTEERADFRTTQLINLDYLDDFTNYNLSSSNRQLLYDIGMKVYPLSGYARSLYQVLTGNSIDLDSPNPRNATSPRSSQSISNNIKSYPNPVKNGLYTVAFDKEMEDCNISVYDIRGIKVHDSGIITTNKHEISSATLNNGIYFLIVSDKEGENVYQSKVVILQE